MLDGHLVEENCKDSACCQLVSLHSIAVPLPLLHFTSIFGTQNDHLLLREVEGDRRGRSHTSGETISRERAGIVNHIVGLEVFELLPRWSDQHVPHEEGMVSTSTDDPDVNPVALIPSSVSIDDVNAVPCVQVVDSTFSVDAPYLNATMSAKRGQWRADHT